MRVSSRQPCRGLLRIIAAFYHSRRKGEEQHVEPYTFFETAVSAVERLRRRNGSRGRLLSGGGAGSGALPGVPDDIVVEIPAVVNKQEIHRIQVDPLPPKIMLTQIQPMVLSLERTLLAIKSQDRSLLLWELLDANETRSYAQAEETLEAILGQEYNREMNDYFRWPQGWEANGVAQTPVWDDPPLRAREAVAAD